MPCSFIGRWGLFDAYLDKKQTARLDPGDVLKRLFVTAHDISTEDHVEMQAVFQKYTDNAVSKTINLKHRATRDDVADAFMLAYEKGCKGITVFRYGSKPGTLVKLDEVD